MDIQWVRRERGIFEAVFSDEDVASRVRAVAREGFGHTWNIVIDDGAQLFKAQGVRNLDRASGIVEWELSRNGVIE